MPNRTHVCEWCYEGPESHVVLFDEIYREHVVRCRSEVEDDPVVVRERNRRLLLGGLK